MSDVKGGSSIEPGRQIEPRLEPITLCSLDTCNVRQGAYGIRVSGANKRAPK
jgi:hypothetical protein